MSWHSLKKLKELHPVEKTGYAVAQGIDHDTVFNWWVNGVLNKSMGIISIVKKRNAHYLKKKNNFWIEVPKSLAEAYALDKNNGNSL